MRLPIKPCGGIVAMLAISVGACANECPSGACTPSETHADGSLDATADAIPPEASAGHADAVAVDAHVLDGSPAGPHCSYVTGADHRIPACATPDGGVSPAQGAQCQPSVSFQPYNCPDFLVAGTHLSGCCVYGSFSDCGLAAMSLDGRHYCGAFYPPGASTPGCPAVTFGSDVMAGCGITLGGGCGALLVNKVGSVTLDFGCVPSNLLPRLTVVDPG